MKEEKSSARSSSHFASQNKEDTMEDNRGNVSDYGTINSARNGQQANSTKIQIQAEQQQADEHRLFMRGKYAFFGGATALYALFYTFCLYQNSSGITYPFFVAGTLVYFYLCTIKSGVPWKRGSRFYLVSIILLGISVFLTDNGYINGITGVGIVLLFVSLMIHQYLDDSKWNFSKYLSAMGQMLIETIGSLGHPVSDGNAWFKDQETTGKLGKGRYVILGILILIPLLLVILALLVSADAVFMDLFRRFFEHIDIWDCIGIPTMAVCVFFVFYAFVAMLNKRVIREECEEKRNQEPVLAITFTSVLALVYMVFCGIQIIYLFMGQGGLPEGYTYASYARQGFFQLLAVCIINLLIVLICLAFFRENIVLKVILTVISLCTYVMVASSAYRMILYIQEKHLTFLRFLVLWGLIVTALLLAGIVASIFRTGFALFRYVTVVVTVCYIALAFVRPDYCIAKYNMSFVDVTAERVEGETSYDDYRYLARLSADAAPLLAKEENYKFLWERSDRMKSYYSEIEEKAAGCGVRTFNLSRYMAGKALEQAKE